MLKIENGQQSQDIREQQVITNSHVQKIELGTHPATFQLAWKGQVTAPIRDRASAEEVQNALNALSNIGGVGGSVNVTGGNGNNSWIVTFGGNTWFRPPKITFVGQPNSVNFVQTSIGLNKRTGDSNLKIDLRSNGSGYRVDIPNGNTFPIDNAPFFTPEKLSYAASNELSTLRGYRLRGYLQNASRWHHANLHGQFAQRSGYGYAEVSIRLVRDRRLHDS